ncbi:hypothetical protein HB818_14425 [Listeria booriae]|uniref:hypothetical protein n=1 Tax=Listeria booriae TaxID=1552123 RepID=UPI0016249E99|nr:hypothetical protein [Listeria booriae]MBC1286955.1 hypothetical protein [Listeria booriae]
MTEEELIVITTALLAVRRIDFEDAINDDAVYTSSYCSNPLLKNTTRRVEIYTDMMRELERREVVKPSWAAKFD